MTETGPTDHIRTKHEVKAFVASGKLKAAEALLKNAQARRELNQSQTITVKMSVNPDFSPLKASGVWQDGHDYPVAR